MIVPKECDRPIKKKATHFLVDCHKHAYVMDIQYPFSKHSNALFQIWTGGETAAVLKKDRTKIKEHIQWKND